MPEYLSSAAAGLVNRLRQSELKQRFGGDADARPRKRDARECAGRRARSCANTCSGTAARESADDSTKSSRTTNGCRRCQFS